MSGNHSHHHHLINNYNRSFAIGIAFNVIFVIIEVGYGLLADSLALIADAGHNFSDVLSLMLAWGASYLSTKHPTHKRTYGLRKVTIMASLVSAVLLLVALGGIAWESIERLSSPEPVNGMIIIVVAAIGVVINTATALLFVKGQKHDLNIRAAYLHMAADAAISLGVVVAGIAIMITGWLWLDPVISLFIVLFILIGTWSLLKDSIDLSIDAVPQGIDVQHIKNYLTGLKNVTEIHDLHIWALSTTETALTVHLVTTHELIDNCFLEKIQEHLHHHFDISHATIQIENEADDYTCILNRDECKF
ncbi:cation diffusion facilitator family transporter [Sulfurovum sp. AR]|uniref:cation diffusion facilitator family transporter n=1 Tax=Sulfurovum sp. AR TaxID=1165841 RepID=UPI00025C4875|nr:cation diffusion facilitator family transporter [Sulfurovum sp. AR]EIF51684.1 cation diffusion facilitator family transporter [Sulfurovum sp. AR]